MLTEPATFERLPIDADRLCEGISKIGYKPSAALMDIADNSITANARNVKISLKLHPDASLTTKGGVTTFRIWDDGDGMTNDQVKNALQLGSNSSYPANSLSKFGLGLKSAGFSLGNRISVLSKKAGVLSHLWVVDRAVIRQAGAYGAYSEAPSQELRDQLNDMESGTAVEVANPLPGQDSANKIRLELTRRLGVTYYQFLARKKAPLNIKLEFGSKEESIEPIDFLFLSDALNSFDPDTYDCKSPVKVLDREIDNPLDLAGPKMRLEIAIFPQDRMSNFAGFSEEERKKIKEYRISRENEGFFIYRNGRLIRWGERLAGVARDDINFRARLTFTDAHDELLHVDVSKQNLMIPEDLEETLETLTRIPLSQARQALQLCTTLWGVGLSVEGEAFNQRTEGFEEGDPEDSLISPNVRRERREALSKKTKEESKKEEGDGEDKDSTVAAAASTTEPSFERIRYSTTVVGSNVAVPGFDTDYETFVRVNKNHPFYQLVLNGMPAADKYRQAFESLLFSSAVAENKTIQNSSTIDVGVLAEIFEKYRRTLSQNLEAWLAQNQDLFA